MSKEDKIMKVIVVMPAYNAEKTLESTIKDIPQGSVDEIILVDDNSSDNTLTLARQLGLKVFRHRDNLGYGGCQKTCYRQALANDADIVVMLHADYQFDSRLIPYMVGLIKDGICDVMLGSRIRTRKEALSGGMPLYKYLANRFLTIIENIILGQNIGEFHTGFRAYSRKVLETILWENNSNDFVFDQEFLVQAVYFGFRIGTIPVPTRYFPEASSINFRRSLKYGCQTLLTLLKYLLHRWKIKKCKLFKKLAIE